MYNRHEAMRSLPVAALALLLVTAGCGGLGGTQNEESTVAPQLNGTPTNTTTPTETSSATSPSTDSLPPAVTPDADDEVDERALYLAHGRALENTSVTWRRQQLQTNKTGSVQSWLTQTVWTNGSTQRYEVESGGQDPSAPSPLQDYWTDGNVTVSQQTLPNGSVERYVSEGRPSGTFANARAGRVVLESVLTGTELQYIGVEDQNGTEVHILASTTEESQITLRVTSDGVIHSFVYRVDTQIDGQELTVIDRFRTYDIGTTTVEQPSWTTNATD